MNVRKNILLLPIFLLLFGCPSDGDMITPEENVTYEVILFEFTPDTGNNTSRLRYEIKFSNLNNTAINGFHRITIKTTANGVSIESSNIATDSSPCYLIEANSDCTINFDEEQSFDIGMVNSIELVNVEYNFVN